MITSLRQIRDESWLLFFILAIIGLCIILYSLRDYLRIVKFIFSLNGPPTLPILGNARFVYDENVLHKMSHTAYESYGPIFRIWLTLLPCVVLLEPEDIQVVLASSRHASKIVFYKMLDNFLGKGLITSRVETWSRHRKILQPAFHLHYLERYAESFARCSERLVKRLSRVENEEIDITSLINDTVYEILNETVLGARVNEKNGNDAGNDLPFRKGKVLVPYRLTRPWLLIDRVYRLTKIGKKEQSHRDELANACRRIVTRKKREIRAGDDEEVDRDTLVDFMIDRSERDACLSEEEIVNECCTFMLAGQDSVGTAAAMTLFLLANNPRWLDKCVAENDEIFDNDGLEYRPKMADLRSMKYLEMCIKESLRLYPSVPLFARTIGQDVKIGERVLPAGCGVILMPYSTHRLPHHFPDPHSFRPERFSLENSSRRHPYAYLPFSAGPRNCIGNKFAMLEIKSIISAVLRRYLLAPVPGKEEIRPKFRLTVRAKGGLWLKFVPRRDSSLTRR